MTLDGIIKGTHLAIPSNSNIKIGCKINKKFRRIQIIWQQNSKLYQFYITDSYNDKKRKDYSLR